VTEVGVNLLWCVPGDVGGSEAYLVRQLLGVVTTSAWRPTAYAAEGFDLAHPDLASRIAVVAAPFPVRQRAVRIAGEATWLRHRARQPLIHHGGGTAPPAARRPYVLTVHDLQYLSFPEHFGAAKRAYFRAVVPASVRRAAAVAVPSEYVRTRVIEAFDVPPGRVHVVPHGTEPDLAAHVTPAAELRARFGLGEGPVLVYPAMAAPHKNHRFLFRMLSERWTDPDLRLVLIGTRGSLSDEIADHPDPRVRHLGRVGDADRNGLLAMSEALVFPSTYEGFGAPLVEAMVLGAPVIASQATCIPDVVGDAGLVMPLDVDAWDAARQTAITDRDRLVAAGRRRAEQFTTEASGRALARVYVAAMEAR
jgi:glycosyltransferase involved in cell wall biosynthesis